jgi:hypothetical protein
MKLPDKDLVHKMCEDPRCQCGCDEEILKRAEQDPSYWPKMVEAREIIAKRAQEIRRQRESRSRRP